MGINTGIININEKSPPVSLYKEISNIKEYYVIGISPQHYGIMTRVLWIIIILSSIISAIINFRLLKILTRSFA